MKIILADTTRSRRAGEQDGVHYHFVTRQKFVDDTRANRFVEWGEFDKHYYGTAFDAIQTAVNSGRTCLLTLKAQVKTCR